jgi:hypothetical protein
MGQQHPSDGILCPYEDPKWLSISMNDVIDIVLQRQTKYTLQGSTSHRIMPSKSYLIQEPPKQVTLDPPFHISHMLKDFIQFSKFKYGRVIQVSYWVCQDPSRGMFPKWNLSHVMNVRWFVGKTFGHGVIDMQGLVWSHFHGRLCRGCVTS